jgi:hypothetical protein
MNTVSVDLRLEVRSVDELLDAAGSPLLGPRIHPEVARAIHAQAAGHPRGTRFRIEVVTPAGDSSRGAEVEAAIRTHFREEADDAEKELHELAHKGRWSFLIAILVVALFIGLSEAVLRLGEGRVVTVLSESLIIVAWVTLWGPAETLLFARFPVRRQRDLARSLAEADAARMRSA